MQNALFQRFTRDAALILTKALPAANAANASDALDLGNPPGRLVDDFDVLVELPATPSLVDAKSITLTIKDSADGVTFAAITGVADLTTTGAGGTGGPAISQRVKLPDTVRQIIRLDQSVVTGGGDNTAISSTLSLVF